MPEWVWLDSVQQYRDLETGRFLSGETAREWGHLAADASENVISEMSNMLLDGRLNLRDWTLLMRDEIKDAHIQQYLLGRGGIEHMGQADWGSIGGMLSGQYRFLDRFAASIAAGEVTPGDIVRRALMYANAAREAYFRAHARALNMPRLPDYPGSGNTVCLTNCRCDWDIRTIRDRQGNVLRWECYWRLRPAEHCTSDEVDAQGRPRGCIQRAQLWNPLVIEA